MTRYERCDCCGISEGAWDDLRARAEQAERERDEALARCDVLRGLADQAAADFGLMARRMEQAQSARRRARADSRRAEARAAVVVWGLGEGGWCVWRVSERWVYYVPFAALETAPTLSCPRLTDSPLADITDAIVDAIAATHGCPESLRVGWEGVRHAD